jgi:type I site-specific restriction-modification system R (restriction) subunit
MLHTMYVDKRLADVQAVQTLSRLNRTAPAKEDTFVLDFVNETDEIQKAFRPYYEVPLVEQQAEPHQLYDLQAKLAAEQVYHSNEIEEFAKVFFNRRAASRPTITPRCTGSWTFLWNALAGWNRRSRNYSARSWSRSEAFMSLYVSCLG